MTHSEGLHLPIASLSVTNKHKPKCLFIWLQTFLAIKCLKCFTLTVISLFSSNDDRQVQCHFKNWIASVNWKTILWGSYFLAPALNVCIMKIKYKNMLFYKPFSLESVWMTLFHLPNSLHPPSFPSSLSNFSHDVSPLSSLVLFVLPRQTAPLPLLLFDLSRLLSLNSTHTLPYPRPWPNHLSFT